jgi:hypothetical protein
LSELYSSRPTPRRSKNGSIKLQLNTLNVNPTNTGLRNIYFSWNLASDFCDYDRYSFVAYCQSDFAVKWFMLLLRTSGVPGSNLLPEVG